MKTAEIIIGIQATTSLSTFLEMIQRKMSLFTIEKISYNELYNNWKALSVGIRSNTR